MNEIDQTARAHAAVRRYCRKYGISPSFPVSGVYELSTDNWRRTTFPFATAAGCYLFYSGDRQLLYVGKVSLTHSIGARVASYFRSLPELAPVHSGWSMPPRYLQVVRVNEPYEAPSLEEYLIRELDPMDNTRGRPRRS